MFVGFLSVGMVTDLVSSPQIWWPTQLLDVVFFRTWNEEIHSWGSFEGFQEKGRPTLHRLSLSLPSGCPCRLHNPSTETVRTRNQTKSCASVSLPYRPQPRVSCRVQYSRRNPKHMEKKAEGGSALSSMSLQVGVGRWRIYNNVLESIDLRERFLLHNAYTRKPCACVLSPTLIQANNNQRWMLIWVGSRNHSVVVL